MNGSITSQNGQASIELVAVLPALICFGLVCFQMLAIGYGASVVDGAAEAAALAQASGKDPVAAARDSLPGWPAGAIEVNRQGELLEVTLRPPLLLPFLRGRLVLSARASVARPEDVT